MTSYVPVLRRDACDAGRTEKNNLGSWCCFEHPGNVLDPDLTDRDLEALKKQVTARLQHQASL